MLAQFVRNDGILWQACFRLACLLRVVYETGLAVLIPSYFSPLPGRRMKWEVLRVHLQAEARPETLASAGNYVLQW